MNKNRKKQVVFVEAFPTIMVYKIAKEFRKNGYETISVRILESKGLSEEFYLEAFDKIIHFNLNFFKMTPKDFFPILLSLAQKIGGIIKATFQTLKLRPYVVIARANPSWPCALILRLFKKTPTIYFPYDIRSIIYSTKGIAKKDRGSSEFEINSEKFCFENADGIIYKSAPDVLNYVEGRIFDKIDFQKLQLSFLPYCSDEFIVPLNKNKLSKKDKEFHLVSAISIGSINPRDGGFYVKIGEEIIKQKIHFHLYHKPNTL